MSCWSTFWTFLIWNIWGHIYRYDRYDINKETTIFWFISYYLLYSILYNLLSVYIYGAQRKNKRRSMKTGFAKAGVKLCRYIFKVLSVSSFSKNINEKSSTAAFKGAQCAVFFFFSGLMQSLCPKCLYNDPYNLCLWHAYK